LLIRGLDREDVNERDEFGVVRDRHCHQKILLSFIVCA
jgi:hypothetical protein